MHKSERWVVGFLLVLASMTFFFPLVTFHVPIIGDQDMSGYDLVAKMNDFGNTIDEVKPKQLDLPQSAPANSAPVIPHSEMPLSVQFFPLIPIEVILGFACAAIALICCLVASRSLAKGISTLGTLAGVAAILHLTIANSDLHSWFHDQMEASASRLADNNPFAALGRQIADLAANSFQIKPGVGLYVLAATLSVSAVLFHSGVLSTLSSTEGVPESAPTENRGMAWYVGLLILLTASLGIAYLWFAHTAVTVPHAAEVVAPPQSTPTQPVTPTQPMPAESDEFKWPTEGLPAYIAVALSTPDLAPSAPSKDMQELVLGEAGQRQFIPPVKDEDCMGSGGCVWTIVDDSTKQVLIGDEQGALHRTEKSTNGYYDLLVEDTQGLYLYEFHGGKYVLTTCYERSNGLGSSARPSPCQ
jgi:hypothetical protein